MDESFSDAKHRLTRTILNEVRSTVEGIHSYTRFNEMRSFTPAQVEVLLNHIDECHKILYELSELNDYELPYRCPKLIYASRELKRLTS